LANLKPGQQISQAYNAARDFIQSKNSNLHFHTNFGFGIGFNYKEDPLMITESNTTLVKPGMTFHARIALSGVHKEPARSVIAIGDTVVINSVG
jgi:Xaa-Pro aminopeptidase